MAIIHGAGHSADKVIKTKTGKEWGHTSTGVMMNGNNLRDELNSNGINGVIDKSKNGTYIEGMKDRYGNNKAKDNYLKNRLND